MNGIFRIEKLRLFGRWERRLWKGINRRGGAEVIEVVLGDGGEVMIADKSVDRGSEKLVEGGS